MKRIAFTLLFLAGDSLAHPGHNAPLVHTHGWDWAHLALGIGIVVAAAIAIWRAE